MTPAARPDPDQLLAHVQAEEARARRGRLRIFFGSSAGVGKTYAMLEAAHNISATNPDVVVGYVEPHGRADTERLLDGLERLPYLPVHYKGIQKREFDLDAALKRHPSIVLVDELAHSNLTGGDPPPRHPKRWQDVQELLDAGINVWTTVNVQHLESLNDLVFQVTGIRQRETLPDKVFDEATDIELIDLPPDDLLARLRAGKVYVADEVATAVERFFRTPNLMALRELALRKVADRVEAAARAFPADHTRTRLAADRVLVAVGPDTQAEQLVRAGKRMADALDATWTVVYVETPALLNLSEADRDRRIDVLRLAESLGAETVTLDGPSPAAVITEYAQTRNATRVIVGAQKLYGWRRWFRRPATASQLIQTARTFDVITIAVAEDRVQRLKPAPRRLFPDETTGPIRWGRYGMGLLTTAICTAVAFTMYPRFELSNLVMVYLLGVTVAGLRFGRAPALVTAALNVVAFDFFFVPPRFSLAISDVQYLVTFVVMLTIALVIASLMASVRQQTRVAGARERRTALLYAMSRELVATRGIESLAHVAVNHVSEVFQCKTVLLLPDTEGKLTYPRGRTLEQSLRGADLAVAQWVLDHGRQAGLGTDTLPATPALYVPLLSGPLTSVPPLSARPLSVSPLSAQPLSVPPLSAQPWSIPLHESGKPLGVLAVLPANKRRVLLPEQRHLLETFASQIGLALERAQLAEAAEGARLNAERESLRNTLLASISHDLRTPLAVIAGAGSALAQHGAALDGATKVTLARSIETKAREMSDLVSNVLDLMRFESGHIQLRRDWETLDDLVGTALNQVETKLAEHPVDVRIPHELPPVYVDATLIVQVFANLFDNIAKYTPPGTHVLISASADGGIILNSPQFIRVRVEDEGPGLPAGEPARLFDKFQRGNEEGTIVGVGLGLAICQAIVRAHGGEIEAHQREGGGARFEFTLPLGEPAV